MCARVIAILNQKGGSGKTTLSTNLAFGILKMGKKVLLVDADPQGSTRDWHEKNGAKLVNVLGMDRETIQDDLKTVMDSYDIIIVDGAPRVSKASSLAIKSADLVLIPVQPSPYDVWACKDIVDSIETRQELTDGAPMARFVISRAIKNTNLSNDVLESIEQYKIPALVSRTTQRVSYADSASTGETVFHSQDKLARQEMSQLVDEVLHTLGLANDPFGKQKLEVSENEQ